MDGIGKVVSGTKTEQLPKDLKPPTTIKGTPAGAVENCAGTMPSRIASVAMCENSHSQTYEVIRFGVNRKTPTSSPVIVGLAQKQTHTIKRWIKTYSVHSFPSSEGGAWQVYDNFLIHDGPDKPMTQYYATAGCIEICGGPNGFVKMNDFIISLSGSTAATRDAKLTQIGASGLMAISYDAATRPPLVIYP
jgi:hypothetical protein